MRALILGLLLCLCPGLATAAERMFTYDSDSPRAKALTGAGLTLTFDQGLLGGARLKLVQATAVPVAVEVIRAERADEAGIQALLPKSAEGAGLYQVVRGAQQGEVLSRAFCPGATKVWLATSSLTFGRPMTVWAVGQGGGDTKLLCTEMSFAWRGEWRLPPDREPPPVAKSRTAPSRGG